MTGDLFGHPASAPRKRYPNAAGHRGVPTSVMAADSIEPHVSALQQKVLDYLATRHGGATRPEVETGCKLSTQTACPRLRELELKSLIKKSNLTRPTPSGRQAVLYVLTAAGLAKATRRSA